MTKLKSILYLSLIAISLFMLFTGLFLLVDIVDGRQSSASFSPVYNKDTSDLNLFIVVLTSLVGFWLTVLTFFKLLRHLTNTEEKLLNDLYEHSN